MELSEQQKLACEKIEKWFREKGKMFVLSGYAGTGKTTLVKHIIEKLELKNPIFATYTGKAALVLRKYSGLPAQTIHSLIYKYIPPNKAYCEKLYKQLKETSDPKEKGKIRRKLKEAYEPKFVLNINDSKLNKADLLVLDECSMVNKEMLNDLLKFNKPILALGDPGQLPPIEGAGAIFNRPPDALLTEIHRQAKGNPIIEVATRVRKFIPPPPQNIGEEYKVFYMSRLTKEKLLDLYNSVDQILCGMNKTRRLINQQLRKPSPDLYPQPGDKLICLRNDHNKGLLNGLFATVVSRGDLTESGIELELQVENLNKPITFNCLRAHFDVYEDKNALEKVRWWERKDTVEFDYGYAITVHKAQGSQWDSVLLVDDKFYKWDREQRAKWLYTAVTRAAKQLTILN